jgi:peptide/nickel transport system substrate-binding protein
MTRDRLIRAAAAGFAAAALIAACSEGGVGGNTVPTGGTPVNGGTATYALPANTTQDWILPFAPIEHTTLANGAYLQYLMFRPMIWPGVGDQAAINWNLSIANEPKYNGNQVTVTLKNYKWSDGTPVTSRDVMFYVNLDIAEKAHHGSYTPGTFPDNVKSVKVDSPTQLTFTTDRAYSPQWFTWNELSQIVPFPPSWDKSSDTQKASCATRVSDCHAVYNYLAGKAKSLKTYATDPLWQVVDGPFKLKAFDPDGHATFVPNPSYSGPVKPRIAEFKTLPFTTEESEMNVLRSGNHSVDVGYLSTVAAPQKPKGKRVGPNPVPNYSLDPLYAYGIDYFPMNQNNPTVGPIFKQTYFRQAFQYLMNQQAIIDGPLKGYGIPTVGPVPNTPPNFLSAKGKQGDPFLYNPGKAQQLLASHGWSVKPGGVSTCTNPTLCGPGIKQGQGLEFSVEWATGTPSVESEMKQLQSNASRLGIKLNLKGQSFNQVVSVASPCKPSQALCKWEIANWGGGWVFIPDYYPTGETLFGSGSGANSGSYTDKANDKLIEQTQTSASTQSIFQWQDYLSQQVPVVWQPNAAYELTEIYSKLRGVTPQNPYLLINPENWYFVK